MKILNFLFTLFFLLVLSFSIAAQNITKKKSDISANNASTLENYKSTLAFAEVLLRKTELEAELESLLISYTEEFPKVKEIRYESDSLKKAMERLAAVKSVETSKLTLALGKLMVRKAELETDLWNLRRKYDDNHPETKRARRKIEIYEAAIKEILG